MAEDGEWEDARRQIALGLMEVRGGQAPPATGQQWMQAADVFLAMHEFELAQTYFERALAAGAPETSVRIGLANSYLALGDTARAEDQLSRSIAPTTAAAKTSPTIILLAKANVYRQQHHDTQALTAFAQAADAAGEDDAARGKCLKSEEPKG